MKKLLVILLALPLAPLAQSVSLSPMSVTAISQTPYASEIMASYKFADLHLIYTSYKVFKGQTYRRPELRYGITLSPEVDLKYVQAEPIIGFYNKPVASAYGSRWNFGLSVYRSITKHVDIYIRHLSNAGLGDSNPGIDWIGLRARL